MHENKFFVSLCNDTSRKHSRKKIYGFYDVIRRLGYRKQNYAPKPYTCTSTLEPRVAASGECGGGLGAVAPAVGDDGPQQVAVGLLPTCPVNSVAESLIAVEGKPELLLPLTLLLVFIMGLVLIFSSARSGQG
uniref:Uncharacterized protein n=1 Tax=Glossina austeni TaxID=7395 RepID=A0A1A9VHM0_GLOAU